MTYIDKEYPLPVNHPRLANACGRIYTAVFEPVNRFLAKLGL